MEIRKRTHNGSNECLPLEPVRKNRRVLASLSETVVVNVIVGNEIHGRLASSSQPPSAPGITCAKCHRTLCNLTTIEERASNEDSDISNGQRVTNEKPEKVPLQQRRPCKNCLSPHKVFYSNKKNHKKKSISPNYRKRVDIRRRPAPLPWSFLSPESDKGAAKQLKYAMKKMKATADTTNST
jgi:hypothetical protein